MLLTKEVYNALYAELDALIESGKPRHNDINLIKARIDELSVRQDNVWKAMEFSLLSLWRSLALVDFDYDFDSQEIESQLIELGDYLSSLVLTEYGV